jgi:hypothetical protein
MRNWFLTHLTLVAMISFSLVMFGVRFFAHEIVDNYGAIGALVTIGAMYWAAVIYERRKFKADLAAGFVESTHFARLSERPAHARD